jgi:hypothetical protein
MSSEKTVYVCPNCGTKGDAVGNATIKCLISVSLHRVKDIEHRFCDNAACDVVYFAEDGSEIFHTADLRERVYQKELHNADVLVCYCFFHTLGDIRANISAEGTSAIVDDIKHGIQAGHCACDWRNPQGTCCLGNVLQIVKAAK